MARRLQPPQGVRAPLEDSALPQVASDPAIQRPLRPEPPSARAGAPAGEPSGSFDALLDAPATARAAQSERATRARSSDRSDRVRPGNDRNDGDPEVRSRRSGDGPKASEESPAKPAETGQTLPGKNAQ